MHETLRLTIARRHANHGRTTLTPVLLSHFTVSLPLASVLRDEHIRSTPTRASTTIIQSKGKSHERLSARSGIYIATTMKFWPMKYQKKTKSHDEFRILEARRSESRPTFNSRPNDVGSRCSGQASNVRLTQPHISIT